MEGKLTRTDGTEIIIKKEDLKSYYGSDYPSKDGTLIVLKDGSEINIKECFKIVDDIFDL